MVKGNLKLAVIGCVCALVLSACESETEKAQRVSLEAETARLQDITKKSIKRYNETRMALQSCRYFDLRDWYVRNNKIQFAAWNTMRQNKELTERVATNLITDEELTLLRKNGTLNPENIGDVGGQLAGLGYGLKYDAGSQACKDLYNAVKKREHDLPYVERSASVPAAIT